MFKTNTNILKAMYITNHSNLTEQNKYIPLFQLLAMSTYNTYINTKAFSCSYSSTVFCFFWFRSEFNLLNYLTQPLECQHWTTLESIYISPGLSIQSLFTYICVLSLYLYFFSNKNMFKPTLDILHSLLTSQQNIN